MGKNNKPIWDMNGVNPIKLTTENIGKHGEIRGRNKKETRALRSACMHHTLKKNGKIVKAKMENIHDGECTCKMCKERMRTSFYSDNEISKIYNNTKPILSQSKMMAAAIGADLNTQREVAGLNLRFDNFPKLYKNMRKIAQKQDEKKAKKKGKNNRGGSAFDSWQIK